MINTVCGIDFVSIEIRLIWTPGCQIHGSAVSPSELELCVTRIAEARFVIGVRSKSDPIGIQIILSAECFEYSILKIIFD